MGLKYIYTGFNKCGTKTIKEAFEILGFKVYDFEENAIFLSKHWIKFFSPKTSTDEKYKLLYEMFKDVDALVEGPNLYFWKEILTVFPECKVVHFQREEDAWYKSVVKQVKHRCRRFEPWFTVMPFWIGQEKKMMPICERSGQIFFSESACILLNEANDRTTSNI